MPAVHLKQVEKRMHSGMSLMSVVVAMALTGILAATVTQVISNQARTMQLIELQGQRESLIRHYKDVVDSGWSATLASKCGSGNFCGGDGRLVIPQSGLYLSDNLYDYGQVESDGKWWRVSARTVSPAKYAATTLQTVIEIRVDFLPHQHPTVKTELKSRQEVIFMPSIPSSLLDFF